MVKMTEDEISEALAGLEGWSLSGGRSALERCFKFTDFQAAFAFMTVIAQKAEEMDHHPEWSNIYNNVDILLTTHSDGGISAKDVALAKFINKLFIDQKLS